MRTSLIAILVAAGVSASPALAQTATPSSAEHATHHTLTAQAQPSPERGPSGAPTQPTAPAMPGQTPGMQDRGTPGQGAPGGMMGGTPGQGAPGQGGMTGGAPGQGAPGQGGMMGGMSGQGAPGQGAPGQGGMMGGMPGMMGCPMMQGGMAGMMGGRGMMGGMAAARGDDSVPSIALQAVTDKMHRAMAIPPTGKVDADFARAMIVHHQGAIDMAKIALAFGSDPQIRKLAEEVVRAQESEIATLKGWLAKNDKQ